MIEKKTTTIHPYEQKRQKIHIIYLIHHCAVIKLTLEAQTR